MALLGSGALVFWHDVVEGGDDDYHAWHSNQHLPERVGVPGFLRGRRCVSEGDLPRYFILYEVEEIATLTSAPYLERLNQPTSWSSRSLANFRNSNRTACRVVASLGHGIGTWVATLQLSPAPGKVEALQSSLVERVLPALADRPALVGAHLLRGDDAASRTETQEHSIRVRPDDIADWTVLIEGYDESAVEEALHDALALDALVACGAATEHQRGIYRCIHSVAEADLA